MHATRQPRFTVDLEKMEEARELQHVSSMFDYSHHLQTHTVHTPTIKEPIHLAETTETTETTEPIHLAETTETPETTDTAHRAETPETTEQLETPEILEIARPRRLRV
jgi:hypothetical protein